jgi:CubicO group peptidase (beta-lactamase class C family)
MELQDYVGIHLAKPLGWGRFGYAFRGHPGRIHSGGGGGIAVRATDMLRFGYLLLHDGRWGDQQIVPADYVHKATTPSPYNPHFAYGLQFELNTDGGAPAAPRDLYWKRGGGGFAVGVAPSLDLVVWKMGGFDSEYEEKDTGLPELKPYDGSRAGWKPTVEENASALRAFEMVVAAINDNRK